MNLPPSQTRTSLGSVESIPIPSTKVYMTEDALTKIFEKFGKICSLKLLKRKDGFTYSHIIYQTIEQARKAINSMNRLQIGDKRLKVNFASQVDKKPKIVQEKQKTLKETKKSFAELLLQKMSSKKKNKKSKKQFKYLQDEKRKLEVSLPQLQKKQKEQQKLLIKRQDQINEIEVTKQIQIIPKYQKILVDEQQDTQAEWSLDFDPADLKKKPNKCFIL